MAIPEEIRRLFEDSEYFIGEVLQGEKLSKKARDQREVLLEGFRLIKYKYQQEFQFKGESGDFSGSRYEDSSDDNQSLSHVTAGLSDSISVASDNQEDVQCEEIASIAAQDLPSIMKQGYLEKKRRDHSFFGSEWQRRFCVLSTNVFYYYGNEKDKQQRGAFYLYDTYLVPNLRKDSKKNACFEIISSDKQVYQFSASNHREAKEWVDHIAFVLKDMNSNFIPVEEEEEEEEEEEMRKVRAQQEEMYDDVDTGPVDPGISLSHPTANMGQEQDDEIYEELPEDDFPPPIPPEEECDATQYPGNASIDYASYYLGLWDCISEEPDELSFKRGDLIHILSKDYSPYGWWVGEMKGVIGIVPKDYLMEAYEI
ncbi:src kinase-associated phosphoprotein 1 [Heterodontus francisci]|uniref:src kinase-associated phosphoprotein 1 n=1 Tax=Heterodontus francisci TaxID=7792 RepID=UPI00355C4E9D